MTAHQPTPRTRLLRRVAIVALVAASASLALPACSRAPSTGPVVTAEFERGTGLYPGSPVRVLGIDIGRITEVDNVDGHVRVRMQLDPGTKLPANAGATIVPLTLLGERYVQIGPAWREGPIMEDGARIPLERTTVPAEIDELLRSLQDFMGSIDPERASDVVTNLAEVLDGRGADINDLIGNAAGTLDILADEGEDVRAIIASLKELTATLEGRTDSIESLIRNYDLVTQVLLDNKGDLEGTITQLDRASVELAGLLEAHEDPLREDVAILADTTGTLSANTEDVQLTLSATVKLFEAAGKAYEERTRSLRVNNQLSAELTSDLVAGRLRDRIAGLCRRLEIVACSDPSSALLNDLAELLPGILEGSDPIVGGDEQPQPPKVPTTTPTMPTIPTPQGPTVQQLLDALVQQITAGLDAQQRKLLEVLNAESLVALLGLNPTLLQVLPDLDEKQIERLRLAKPEDVGKVMLELFNEVRPPDQRLDDPILPPITTPTIPPIIPGLDEIIPTIPGLLGG